MGLSGVLIRSRRTCSVPRTLRCRAMQFRDLLREKTSINFNPSSRYNATLTYSLTMTNLDLLLLKGPPSGDLEGGLNELRFTILTKGMPANNDGMVNYTPHPPHYPPQLPFQVVEQLSFLSTALLTAIRSLKCAYTSGSSYSTPPPSAPTSISTSSAKAHRLPTLKSATTLFAHWPQTLSSAAASPRTA